ncbi:MAG: DMT family transporter [Lachnospiraceae bacterium]
MLNYMMLLFPAMMWGTLGVFVRYIPMSSAHIALVRTVVGSVTLVIIYMFRGNKIDIRVLKNNFIKLFVAGACIGFNWVILFEAYKVTSVSVATVVYYIAPAVVIVVSPILFAEKLSWNKMIGVLCAIVGMAFVSFSAGVGEVSIWGIFMAFCGAMMYATVTIVNKFIKDMGGFEAAMWEMIFAAGVLIPYCFLVEKDSFVIPDALGVVNVLTISILHTGVCYGIYFAAIQRMKAQSVAICSFADPFTALIISALFLRERMTLTQVIGAVLIIGGVMFAEVYHKRRSKQS